MTEASGETEHLCLGRSDSYGSITFTSRLDRDVVPPLIRWITRTQRPHFPTSVFTPTNQDCCVRHMFRMLFCISRITLASGSGDWQGMRPCRLAARGLLIGRFFCRYTLYGTWKRTDWKAILEDKWAQDRHRACGEANKPTWGFDRLAGGDRDGFCGCWVGGDLTAWYLCDEHVWEH